MNETQRIRNVDIDIVKTNRWVKCITLKAETEGLIMAARDQSQPNRNYPANFIKRTDQTQYSDCVKKTESITDII